MPSGLPLELWRLLLFGILLSSSFCLGGQTTWLTLLWTSVVLKWPNSRDVADPGHQNGEAAELAVGSTFQMDPNKYSTPMLDYKKKLIVLIYQSVEDQ